MDATSLSPTHPNNRLALTPLPRRRGRRWFDTQPARVLPGLLLCIGVSVAAVGLERLEAWLAGATWLEALVLAILVGVVVRTAWSPGPHWIAGINFSAKFLLELAVVLLGASVSARTVLAAGPGLLFGIAGVVVVAIVCSYAIARLLGLPHRMATLIACGNSICGNSAIAAVAPVIGAEGKDVATAIAFTAVLGVVVVVALPLAVPLFHLSAIRYGALAGLTVYAVPQVLAATAPVGAVAVQLGTLVKLVRVLMLGPVVLALSLLSRGLPVRSFDPEPGMPFSDRAAPRKLPLHKVVPWFIAGFLLLAGLRSAGFIPNAALLPTARGANLLTVISMAALGLETDLRVVAHAGSRAIVAVIASLVVLGAISLGLICLLGLA